MGNDKKAALLIEDDENIAELLAIEVRELGFELDMASNGQTGLDLALGGAYAFILLDLNLPDLEGVEVCKRVRERDKEVPIIVLTARADDLSKVLLIELGADDYITKPFNNLEVRARIKAILRRTNRSDSSGGSNNQESQLFRVGGLEIDFEKRRVNLNGEELSLTPREFDILRVLSSRPGRPYSRSELCTEAYGYDSAGYDQHVSSHINRLRKKIEPDPEDPIYILTVRGVGYSLTDKIK